MSTGSDSSDDDIFVVRRIKPVGKLTKQKALDIKKMILDRESYGNSSIDSVLDECKHESSINNTLDLSNQKRKSDCYEDDEISIVEERVTSINRRNVGFDLREEKTPKKNEITPENSPSKLITHYYTPTKRSSLDLTKKDDNLEYGKNSSNNRKKFKSDSYKGSPVSLSKSQHSTRNTDKSKSNGDVSSDSNHAGSKKVHKSGTSVYYSGSLKKIIHHEISNQALLEQQALQNGETFDRLLTEEEFRNVEKFFSLPDNAFELFARMLCRKKGWHRITSIEYADIKGDMKDIFVLLNNNNFVDFDIENDSLENQLNLLTRPELQNFCKIFGVKAMSCNKKEDYINAILRSGKTQRSLSEMWLKGDTIERKHWLKTEIGKVLGSCMRLNESFLALLNRLLTVFSLPHNIIEDDKWSIQIHMMNELAMGNTSFPNYKVKPSVIFKNRDDLILYEESMDLFCRFDCALFSRNYEEFTVIGQKAKNKFKELLNNERYKERVRNVPPFLRKFSAGSVYAKILTTYCEKYKRSKESIEVAKIMEMLLNQDVFCVSKKGTWYNLLVQAYSDMGKSEKAGLLLLTALKEDIGEVARLMLQQKGGQLLKKKKNALKKGDLRDELDDVCSVDIIEPFKIEIKARALDKSEAGVKTVYVEEDDAGDLAFSSVEERAIDYYKHNDYPLGVHDEGLIIQTMCFLIFFDIIYGLSPPGVFQSPYQSHPLDFSSRCFYLNRKNEIDGRLREMRNWSIGKFQDVIFKVHGENDGVRCVIPWKDNYTPNMLCDVLRCLGTNKFTSICERLIQNVRLYRSGFPDLTLWNPLKRKCKFVEVKSPNDKLNPNQRLWLHFLWKHKISCEVCNVKNIASRKIKT